MSWPKPAPIEPIDDSATGSAGPLDQIARSILARYKPVEPAEPEPAASAPVEPPAAIAATPASRASSQSAKPQAKRAAAKTRSAAVRKQSQSATSAKRGKSAARTASITPAAVGAATQAAKKSQKRRSVSGPEALAAMKRLWERMNAPIEMSRTEAPSAPPAPSVPLASTPRPHSRLVAPELNEPDPVEALKNFIPDLRLFPIEDAPRKQDNELDEQDVFHLIDNDFDPRKPS